MSTERDAIPVLTDVVEEPDGAQQPVDQAAVWLEELESHFSAAIHEHADELVHNACREMEAVLIEHVSDRLKAELPSLVAGIIDEHFRGPRNSS